jgi:hypothetical protein
VTTEGTPKINTHGLEAHPARCAAWMPVVKGMCPSCGSRSLFLAVGGHVTCANLSCKDPTSAADALEPS